MNNLRKLLFLPAIILLAGLSAVSIVAQDEGSDPLEIDPDRIINESYNFLTNREPDMTEAEYAIYEKVIPMVFKNKDFALTLLETMIADDEPESPAFSFMLGNVYFSIDEHKKAEGAFQQAVKEFPDFLRAWLNMGMLYYNIDQFEKAIPCYIKAIELGNREAETYGVLGYCLAETGKTAAAEMAYTHAVAINPDNDKWIEILLQLYLETKQFERAEPLLKQLLKAESKSAQFWLFYADMLIQQKRYLEAIVILEIANGMELIGTEGRLMLADLYYEQNFYPDFLKLYGQILENREVVDLDKLLNYCRSLIHSGKLADAEKILALMEEPATKEFKNKLLMTRAEFFRATEEKEKAVLVLEELIRLDPMKGDALMVLGQMYKDRSEWEKADFIFERAEKLTEFSYYANLELANIAVRNRAYGKAVGHVEKALSLKRSATIQDYLVKIKQMEKNYEPILPIN